MNDHNKIFGLQAMREYNKEKRNQIRRLHRELQRASREHRQGYHISVSGILNAYLEGDASPAGACGALDLKHKIKPLDWHHAGNTPSHIFCIRAATPFGFYEIVGIGEKRNDGSPDEFSVSWFDKGFTRTEISSGVETLDGAKQVAQNHWEGQIGDFWVIDRKVIADAVQDHWEDGKD